MGLGSYHIFNKRQALLMLAAFFILSALSVLAVFSVPTAIRTIMLEEDAKLPINCTDRAGGVVSLTFDAYLSGERMGEICSVLSKSNVKATFFVTGELVERCTDSILELHRNGQEIMNASDQRLGLVSLRRQKIINRINGGCDMIQAVTGIRPALFRPSDGLYDETLLEAVKMLNIFPIGCDVDSFDIVGLDKEGIVKRVTSLASSGSIIRLNADGKHTLEALPGIIEKLKEKEYKFIPVSAMIYTDDYALKP